MTIPQSVNTYGVAVGTSSSGVPFISSLSPSSTNVAGPTGPFKIGQRWINDSSNETFTLTSFSVSNGTVSANWTQEGGTGSGSVQSVNGTTNQIAVSPTTGNVIVSLPTTVVAPGSIAATSSITATTTLSCTAQGFSVANNLLQMGNAGGKVVIATGSNCSVGTGTLGAGGTVTISTTVVDSSSLIFLTATSKSANSGSLSVGTITSATGFVVNSTNTSDTNTFNWWVIN